jgi:hypothetical protein
MAFDAATGRFTKGPPPIDRLLSAVEFDTNGGCWLWSNAPNAYGYGQVKVDGRFLMAHRLSYEHHNGPVGDGLLVLHKCDVRACVNPDHLFVGTHKDNAIDAVNKGRWVDNRGERHGMAKLSNGDVLEIKELIGRGVKQAVIAKKFSVDPSTISDIKRGKRRV